MKSCFKAVVSCRICIAGGGIPCSVVVLRVWWWDSQQLPCPHYFSLRTWRQIFKLGWFNLAPFLPRRVKKPPDHTFLLHTCGPVSAVPSPSPVDWKILVTISRVGGITLFKCQPLAGSRGKANVAEAHQYEEQWHFSDSYQLMHGKSPEIRILPFQHLSSF